MKIAKKLDKYRKEKEKITRQITLDDKAKENKRSMEKAKDSLKQLMKKSYDREADRMAKASVAMSKQMVKAYEHLGRNIAEDKEELRKDLEPCGKPKHLTKAEKKALKEEKEGWKTVVDKKGTSVSPVSKLELQSKKNGSAKTSGAAYPKTPGGSSGRYRGSKAKKTSDEKTKRPGK